MEKSNQVQLETINAGSKLVYAPENQGELQPHESDLPVINGWALRFYIHPTTGQVYHILPNSEECMKVVIRYSGSAKLINRYRSSAPGNSTESEFLITPASFRIVRSVSAVLGRNIQVIDIFGRVVNQGFVRDLVDEFGHKYYLDGIEKIVGARGEEYTREGFDELVASRSTKIVRALIESDSGGIEFVGVAECGLIQYQNGHWGSDFFTVTLP